MFEHIQEKPSLVSRLLKSRRFQIVCVIAMLGAVLLALLVAFWATPYYSVWSMKRAAQNRDATTFSSYIDFPRLRESLKAELNAKMLFDMKNNKELKDNPFSGLALLAAPTMINNIIDGYVTPAAIERGFKEELKLKDQNVATETFNKDFLTKDGISVDSAYQSSDEFHVIVTGPEQKQNRLVFERRSLFWWQLVGMKLD